MGRPTLWGAGEILRTYFSQAASPPPSFWLALIKDVEPNAYISGEELNEPNYDYGYTRVEIPNTLDTFGDQNTGQLHMVFNQIDIVFPTVIGTTWGEISFWALCDSEVDGNVVFFGDFEESQQVDVGDQAKIPTSLLTIEVGPFFFDEEP